MRSNYSLIILALVFLYSSAVFSQPRVNVPPLISAPVILYDEGNNRIPDGDYQVRVRLFDDLTGDTLFEEEHLAEVRHGICHLNIGLGKAIDSNGRAASGGLDYTHFLVEGDIGVEILVEGQSNPQLLTYLSSQPYSFISQMALNVPGESISSYHIKDQSISLDDLHPSVIEQLSQGNEVIERVVESNATPLRITTDEVYLPDGVVLKNSGGDTLAEVLNGIDRSLDTIREVHVKQRVSQINENIENVENNFNGGLENLSNQLQQEVNDRIVADNDLSGSLNQINNDLQGEIANRIAGDTALDGRINTVTNNLNQEINNRTNADNNLTQSLNTEIQNRTNADNNLSGRINATNANLATETNNRINTDNNLSNRIAQETQNRQQADILIQQTIENIDYQDIQGNFDENSLSNNIVRVNHPDARVRDLIEVDADIDELRFKQDELEQNIQEIIINRHPIAYGQVIILNRDEELIDGNKVFGINTTVNYFTDNDPREPELQGTIRVDFLEPQPDANFQVNLTVHVSSTGIPRFINLANQSRDGFDVRIYEYNTERDRFEKVFDDFTFEVYDL